jgi:hypothetical protein
MKTFKILILLFGTISLTLLHSHLIKVKGVDLFQCVSFVVLHGMWYSFCMKTLVKPSIYAEER